MELYLDDRKTETRTPVEAPVGDLIKELKSRLSESGRIIVGIRCDGIDVEDDDLAGTLLRPGHEYRRIDMHTADRRVLVADALQTARHLLDSSTHDAATIVDELARGRFSDALPKMGECCKTWLAVHEGICNAMTMLGIDPSAMAVEGRSIPQVLSVPLELLKQLKEVVEVRDFVLLSDILTYEFPEVIASWRKLIDAVSDALSTCGTEQDPSSRADRRN